MTGTVAIRHAVVGTAGHIDHGKSSLVKALTGTDPDRLKEEQARGLTIDLGYAEYRASDGRDIGLIDVPGHERFVRNMVAGATGIDVVMLVVAADDSVMPQTREHLEIMQILGIERGFIVMTKIDLVEPGMPDLVEDELREFVRGTFLESARVVRCSNVTGEGLADVKAELERIVAELPPRDPSSVFRMPVQRSFTISGYGTVVTGVPLSGRIRPGDELEVLPQTVRCRVRGLQVHHRAADEGCEGHRVAVNVTDINYKDVRRGDVLATPGLFQPTTLVEVRFRLLPSWREPLETHASVRFHVGCTEVLGTLVLLERRQVEPDESILAQVRLDEPVVVAPGDHYLLRLASPEKTLGGGVVLGETRYRQKQGKEWVAQNLALKERSLGDLAVYLEAVVRGEGLHPIAPDKLSAIVHETPDRVAAVMRDLAAKGRLTEIAGTRDVLHAESVTVGGGEVEKALLALHEKNHYAYGFTVFEVSSAVRHVPAVVEMFIRDCLARKTVERQADQYRLRSFKGGLSQEDRRLIGWVEDKLRSGGLATVSPADMAKELQRPEKRVLNLVTMLEAQGRAKTVAEGVVLHRDAIKAARDKVVEHCQAHGELASNFAKELFGGATRKYVIPLLEYFDALGLTVRNESARRLKPGYENVLAE